MGQFLDRDIISKPTVPSTWKKELVGTVYILDVAPWWYLSDLTQALAPSVQCRYIADRVRWSVGEMRTATWRLTRGKCVTANWESLLVGFWDACNVCDLRGGL